MKEVVGKVREEKKLLTIWTHSSECRRLCRQVNMFFGLRIASKRQNNRLLSSTPSPPPSLWPADLLTVSTPSRCSASAFLPAPLELRAQPGPLWLDTPPQPTARLFQLQPGLRLPARKHPSRSCPPSPPPAGSSNPLAGPRPPTTGGRVGRPETRPSPRPQLPRASAGLGLRAGARAQASHRQPVHVALSSAHPAQPPQTSSLPPTPASTVNVS